MVNGCFRCLGSSQHLKNRFGDGYSIKIRLKSSSTSTSTTILDCFSSERFLLKERHINILHYEVAEEFVSLKQLFTQLEDLLQRGSISDYSVSQNTLDNVFVNFVRNQCDTELLQPTSQTSTRQRRTTNAVLDDTFDDGSFVLNRRTTTTTTTSNRHVSSERLSSTVVVAACDCRITTKALEVLDCSKL